MSSSTQSYVRFIYPVMRALSSRLGRFLSMPSATVLSPGEVRRLVLCVVEAAPGISCDEVLASAWVLEPSAPTQAVREAVEYLLEVGDIWYDAAFALHPTDRMWVA